MLRVLFQQTMAIYDYSDEAIRINTIKFTRAHRASTVRNNKKALHQFDSTIDRISVITTLDFLLSLPSNQ